MKRRMQAIVVAIIIVLPITIKPTYAFGAQSEGNFEFVAVVWGSPSSPSCVGPGMQTQLLTVVLKYNGSDMVAGLKAELYLPWYLRDAISKSNVAESKYTGVITKNQVVELKFWIDVEERAPLGEYEGDLILHVYRSGLWLEADRLTIDIILAYTDKISIKTKSPIKVYSGYSNLTIYIENLGSGYSYGALIKASTPLQQVLIIKSDIAVGDIQPNSIVGIDIPIYASPSLIGSLVPLYLRMGYIDSCGFNKTFSTIVYLYIEQPKEPQITVKITPTTLIAGVKNAVKITVANTGTTVAKGLT